MLQLLDQFPPPVETTSLGAFLFMTTFIFIGLMMLSAAVGFFFLGMVDSLRHSIENSLKFLMLAVLLAIVGYWFVYQVRHGLPLDVASGTYADAVRAWFMSISWAAVGIFVGALYLLAVCVTLGARAIESSRKSCKR